MNKMKTLLGIALAALTLLSCAACTAQANPTPAADPSPAETTGQAETAEPAAADGLSFTSGGYTLNIPEEYKDLLLVTTDGLQPGELFSVSEAASVAAAEKKGYEKDSGLGELGGIKKITTDELHQLLCGDMSGLEVFAQDEQGNFFLYTHPTDVRIEREGELTDADFEQWSKLNGWVGYEMLTDFINTNPGLYRAWRGNSELEIIFNQMLWQDKPFTLTSLDYLDQEIDVNKLDKNTYLTDLLDGLSVEWVDEEAPDGEYLVLNLPEDGLRIDFFSGDMDVVRMTYEGSDFESVYRATYGEGPSIGERMRTWLADLAAAQ